MPDQYADAPEKLVRVKQVTRGGSEYEVQVTEAEAKELAKATPDPRVSTPVSAPRRSGK